MFLAVRISYHTFILMKNTEIPNKCGLFIGQAPPEKTYKVPYTRTRLYQWFSYIGLDVEGVQNLFGFEALVNEFPGKTSRGHRVPTFDEIQAHIPKILNQINSHSLRIVVPLGKIAIQQVLNINNVELDQVIGKSFKSYPFGKSNEIKIIIPLPHPSGLNTWVFKNNNDKLLYKALDLIKEELQYTHNHT